MSDINAITNSIANDYLSYVGKGEAGKTFLTPQEYLLFRTQAMEELKIGMHVLGATINNGMQKEEKPKTDSYATEKQSQKSETKTEKPLKETAKPVVPEQTEGKIIPISQASKTQNDKKTNNMLERMKKTDG